MKHIDDAFLSYLANHLAAGFLTPQERMAVDTDRMRWLEDMRALGFDVEGRNLAGGASLRRVETGELSSYLLEPIMEWLKHGDTKPLTSEQRETFCARCADRDRMHDLGTIVQLVDDDRRKLWVVIQRRVLGLRQIAAKYLDQSAGG